MKLLVAGQDVVKHLLQSSDVLIENFKAGGLAKKLGKRSFRVPGDMTFM